jgi:hypothetical protein
MMGTIATEGRNDDFLQGNGTLKVYEKLSRGMCTTHADIINPDLLAFITR